ncbi:MAG: type II secretion system F family protein [Rheinheimera sp.]
MTNFQYSGFDQSGAKVSGDISADSIDSARQMLRQQGVLVKTLQPQQLESTGFSLGKAKVSLSDLEFLTTELSVLLDAGLKIDKGIDLLNRTNKKPGLATLLDKISKSLRGGKQLSQALQLADDKLFDSLYVNLVSIGEATGKLPDVFRSLAADLAFKRDLQQKVTQALTYPMVILFVCLSSIVFIFNYVVPNLETMFQGKTDLPVYTQLLLSSSAWMRQYQWYLLGAIIASVFLLKHALQKPEFQHSFQKWQLNLPVFKQAVVLVERIRFNSGLAMMLNAGVSVDQALMLSCGNIKNALVRRELEIAINKIKRGDALSGALRQTLLYPDFFASLLAVGEESGELTRIFREIAERSQREFSSWVTRMTSLLEPLLIVVMGGIVGGVVVIMMLSITGTTDVGI